MSKKKLFMIIIVAVICVAALSVALVMVRGKKEKSINLGKSSEETDEQRAIGIRIFTELPNQRMVIIISHMILMELL